MNLTHKDIIARQRNLIVDSYIPKTSCNIPNVYENLSENYSYSKAKMILENWQVLSNDEDIALNKVLEVFSIIVDNDNESNIKNAASIIESKVIPKLRNAKQTRHLNNYKIGWLKHRHTSMLNDTKDNMTAVQRAKSNGGYLGNSLHPHRKYKRDIYGRKMGEENKKEQQQGEGQDNSNEEVAEECFNQFIQIAYVNEQCDRVLNNHAKLSKRFNLDSKVRSCPLSDISLQSCIYDICNLIESYDIPFGVKYNIALENIMYLMVKNCMPVSNKFILETVTDYFLFQEEVNDDRLKDMKYILENTKFFSVEDLEPVSYLIIDEQVLIDELENKDFITPVYENKLHDMYLKWKEKRVKTSKQENAVSRLKIKKIIHDYKKSHKKSIEKFKDAISRIFIQRPEAIIQELPDIMMFVRLGIVIGATSINPILGVVTLITGFFLKMKVSREQMAKVVEQYSKERDKYKKLKDETEDEKKKEKYTALYKQYKKDTETLEMYESDLYTDAENEKREEEKWTKEAEAEMGDNNDDFDFDFDMDFDFEESVKYTEMLSILYEQLDFTKAEIMGTIKNNIHNMTNEDIYNITEAVKLCNDIFDCPRYIAILEDEMLSGNNMSYLSGIQRKDTIKNCIHDIEQIKYDSLLESYTPDNNCVPTVDIMYDILKCKHDIMEDTLELVTRYKNSTINEAKENSGMSFMSKLKIASANLKRFALKAKDKDKQLSLKMDSEITRTAKAAKRAMISNNRESIIRGSFLPSASKCIHIALASGAAYLINPVLAIIGLIGFIGCSKVLTEKERNLILDDIDIEIKMCDKYLKIAEDKDDLVAVREIMKTKRDLERQRTRILYNKNYVFKGKKQYDMPDKSKVKDDD